MSTTPSVVHAGGTVTGAVPISAPATHPDPPVIIRPDIAAIARYSELTGECRFVVWNYDRRIRKDGRVELTKVPKDPRNGRKAQSNNPATWGSFDEALRAYETGRYSGIGFMLGDGWI